MSEPRHVFSQNVYFAHSMKDYGTKAERDCRSDLEKRWRVMCPNRDLWPMRSFDGSDAMQVCLTMVTWCDFVVVMEHQGHVGKGVHTEIESALKQKKRVLVWRDGNTYIVTGMQIVDRNDWKVKYAKLIIVEF